MYEIYEQLLQKHGVTSYKVSKDTGISQSVFSAWKNGTSTPKADKIQKIADYFNVPADYILTGKMPDNIDESIIAQNENEKRLLISFRNAGNLTGEQMDELETLFSQSMDLYLKAKGLKK